MDKVYLVVHYIRVVESKIIVVEKIANISTIAWAICGKKLGGYEMMLNEEVSKKLKSIIKNGKYEEFLEIVKSEDINPSNYFFAKRDKQCLLYAALCQKFMNKNFEGRIKIANYLIDKGADI